MFVSVKYHKRELNGFGGSAYTYETHLPLAVGTVVAAPVKNRGTGGTELKKAVVVEVDLPEPSFPCSVITETWEEAEGDA